VLGRTPFHLVSNSPWPFLLSSSLLLVASSFVCCLHQFPVSVCVSSFFACLVVLLFWTYDIIIEATFCGAHTARVRSGLVIGWLAFLCSEVIFFASFFWAYFHFSLSPDIAIGSTWPPAGLEPLDYLHLPLLNTIILLTSSITVTWSHHCLLNSSLFSRQVILFCTLILASAFLALQCVEYSLCSFTIADRCYGSIFYLATGFHGFHVALGSLLLFVALYRLVSCHFTASRHLGFIFAIWYWHFVDVI